MQHADAAGSDEQQPRCRVGRPRRGTALQQSQRRPSRGKRAASPAEAAASPSGTASRGRGRKRQRQQAPDPPPPPPEPQEEEQSQGGRASDDGATDDENAAGGSDSEAAALEEGAQAGAQPPGQAPVPAVPQLSTREQARRLLMRMGIPADRADLALDEAEEQAEGRGFEDPLAWAEQAQIVLACRVEFEEERDQLAQAMDVSLQEEQQRKQARLPLHQRPDDEIWQEFFDSAMLRMLAARASLPSLLAPPLRKPLLDYLQLEKRCKKWYCAASHYFGTQAEQLAALLGEAPAPSAAACAGDAATGHAAAGACAAAAAAAAGAAFAAAPGASGVKGMPAGLPDIGEDLAAVLAAELSERQEQVQAAVYSMPAGSDSTAVPQLFLAAVPEGQQPEVVEVLSDSDEEGGGMQHQQELQQQQEQQEQQQQQQKQPQQQRQEQQQQRQQGQLQKQHQHQQNHDGAEQQETRRQQQLAAG